MKTILILVLFFVLGSLSGNDLSEYLKISSENNPALKAKYNDYLAALQKVPQAGALPDPQISFGIFTMPMERYSGNQIADISIMQMFPWFGTLGAAKRETALMAKAKFEEFNESKSMLHYEVKASWYSLYLLEQEISSLQENVEILKTLELITLSRYASGDTGGTVSSSSRMQETKRPEQPSNMSGMNMSSSPKAVMTEMPSMGGSMQGGGSSMVNILRIQMEINDLKNRIATLEDQKRVFTANFNKLLNRPTEEEVILPSSLPDLALPLSISEIPEHIRNNNPMLKMLELEEKAFQEQQKMNRRMSFPMIGIGLQYGIFEPRAGNTAMMNGKDMIMPMVTFSIPLWRNKYTASVKEAQYRADSVVELRQDTINSLSVSYEEALADFRSAERRLDLFRKQTQLGQQVLDILTVEYSTNGSNFEELLRMQQQLLDYKLQLLIAQVDGVIATAMLERLMGR